MARKTKSTRKGAKKSVKASNGFDSKVYYERMEQATSKADFEAIRSDILSEIAKHSEKVFDVKGEDKMVEYMTDNTDIVFSRFFGDDNLGENKKEKNVFMLKVARSLARHLKIDNQALWSGYHKFMRDTWENKLKFVDEQLENIENMGEDKFKSMMKNIDEMAW